MVKITNKDKFIEFVLSNETHLINKSNIELIRLDEYVAIIDNSGRQRQDKRFIIKFDEVTGGNFNNGLEFYNWLSLLTFGKIDSEIDLLSISENTRELRKIKDILKEQLKFLKKIYNPE